MRGLSTETLIDRAMRSNHGLAPRHWHWTLTWIRALPEARG